MFRGESVCEVVLLLTGFLSFLEVFGEFFVFGGLGGEEGSVGGFGGSDGGLGFEETTLEGGEGGRVVV